MAASLLSSLPRAVIIAAADQDLSHIAAITLLEDEIKRDAPGQQTLLDRLLDLNLVFALRAWWARADVQPPGWASCGPARRPPFLWHPRKAPSASRITRPVVGEQALSKFCRVLQGEVHALSAGRCLH